jgi:hypothetical protein
LDTSFGKSFGPVRRRLLQSHVLVWSMLPILQKGLFRLADFGEA